MGQPDQTRVRASIRQFPLFVKLDKGQLDVLAAGARFLEVTRGDILWDSRTVSAGFYGVLDGRLKLALLSRCGREHVFDILLPGRSFGEYTIQSSAPCPLYVEALKKSEVLCLNRNQLLSAVERWPELNRSLVGALTDDLHRLLNNLATCCLQSATQRVVQYLLSQAERTNTANSYGTVTLPVCKAIVACSLDLSAETFSRELHRFEKDGLVAVNRRTIQIFDIGRLQQFAF
jgi:CRP-like cAMP-binding protein